MEFNSDLPIRSFFITRGAHYCLHSTTGSEIVSVSSSRQATLWNMLSISEAIATFSFLNCNSTLISELFSCGLCNSSSFRDVPSYSTVASCKKAKKVENSTETNLKKMSQRPSKFCVKKIRTNAFKILNNNKQLYIIKLVKQNFKTQQLNK